MAEVRRQEFVCSLAELAANPSKVLAENEFLYVRQADGKLKMMCGDGVTAISALPYTIDIGAMEQAVIDAQAAQGKAEDAQGRAENAQIAGEAQSGTLGFLVDNTKDFTGLNLVGKTVGIVIGDKTYYRDILDATGDTLTFSLLPVEVSAGTIYSVWMEGSVAEAIPIIDADGNYTSKNVEGVLSEVGTQLADSSTQMNTLQTIKADKTEVNAVDLRVDNLVIPISAENTNIEVTDAHNSIVKDKNFASLKARFEEGEAEFKTHKNDYATYIGSEFGKNHVIRELPNGVTDEIDYTKREYLKRVAETLTLTGVENWQRHGENDDYMSFYLNKYADMVPMSSIVTIWDVDGVYPSITLSNIAEINQECLWIAPSSFGFAVSKSSLISLDVVGFKTWLGENQTTIIYQLATPTILPFPSPMSPNTEKLVGLLEGVENINTEIKTKAASDVYNYVNFENSYIGLLTSTGDLLANTETQKNHRSSELVPVKQGDVVRSRGNRVILVYNVEKTVIGFHDLISAEYKEFTADIDGFIRFSTNIAKEDMAILSLNNLITVYMSSKDEILNEHIKITEKNMYPFIAASGFKDKVLVSFGDSIFGNFVPPVSIPYWIGLSTGMIAHNVAIGGSMMVFNNPLSGSALVDAVVSGDYLDTIAYAASLDRPLTTANINTLASLDFNTVDYVTCAYGINEFLQGKTIEGVDMDIATFKGAYRYFISTLLTAYPHLKIIVTTPTYKWDPSDLTFDPDITVLSGNTVADFVQATIDIGKEFKIPVCDTYNDLGINLYNRTIYFDGIDGTHPNAKGRELIANHISGKIKSVY